MHSDTTKQSYFIKLLAGADSLTDANPKQYYTVTIRYNTQYLTATLTQILDIHNPESNVQSGNKSVFITFSDKTVVLTVEIDVAQ